MLINDIIFIGSGILITLGLMIGGVIIGLILGSLLAILRHTGLGAWFIMGFISVIRGTPLLLQLSLLYFTLPTILGTKLNLVTVGILAFGINSAAYVAEILRAGIENLPKGQFEAAQSLQIPKWPLWRDIVLPQVLRNILPALVNEFIALLKETAIISTLGGMDLTKKAQIIAAEQFTYFAPLCIAGAYYYSLIALIEFLGKKLEKRVNYVKH